MWCKSFRSQPSTLGNLVLLAHEIAEKRNYNGIERSMVQANLERQIGARVANLVDGIGRVLLTESGARLVTFQPSPHQITGSRLIELLQKQHVIETGKRPEFIEELETIQQVKKIA